MNREEAIELIRELGGDEHNWVDFKEDYYIGGIEVKTGEFVKDVAALTNTITSQEHHYLIIGVDDSGNLVGVSDDAENSSNEGPRHIFSYDESDIQQILDSKLEPLPHLTWYTFENGSEKFGILEITPLDTPPTLTVKHINDDSGNRILHKGLVFVRTGSNTKIAGREEIENIIRHRIHLQRDEILDGVHKAVQIGPEYISRLGDAIPDDAGIPITSAESPDSADFQVAQRFTRDPASNLDQELNEDIAQWKHRGDDFIGARPLWRYYANPDELTLDKPAVHLLTQAAIKNYVLGVFWLKEVSTDIRPSILLDTPYYSDRVERASQILLLMNDPDAFHELLNKHDFNYLYGVIETCERKLGNTMNDRANFLLNNSGYALAHKSWNNAFDVTELTETEICELIPELANNLADIQEIAEERMILGDKCDKFRNALWDLEVMLGKHTFS